MANTRELRRRIKSIKNTSQITKAMEMVAATKMRKAQTQALNSRPYNLSLQDSLKNLLPNIAPHPLTLANKSNKAGILLLTTDKALCGALNTNVLRAAQNFIAENHSHSGGKDVICYSIGKKGRNYIVKTNNFLEADFENHEVVSFSQAASIGKYFIKSFLDGSIGEIHIIYPHFISTLRQEPKIMKLLPINVMSEMRDMNEQVLGFANPNNFLLEPNTNELLEYILIHSIETKIYGVMIETKACEHSARMIAMQNATNNAKDLVEDLQLFYNQTRQDTITRELLEITSAQAALE